MQYHWVSGLACLYVEGTMPFVGQPTAGPISPWPSAGGRLGEDDELLAHFQLCPCRALGGNGVGVLRGQEGTARTLGERVRSAA